MIYELNIPKTNNEYIDINHRITHLEFETNKQIFCIPIKPCQMLTDKKYKGNCEISEINFEIILPILEKINKYIDDIKYLKYNI